MPSVKLIAGFAAILAFALALLYAQRAGLAQGRAEGEARVNAIVAQHSLDTAKQVEDARTTERVATERRLAAETAVAGRVESRIAPRQAQVDSTVRAQREAERADQTFAACLALPLPDGLRREPPVAGLGDPAH